MIGQAGNNFKQSTVIVKNGEAKAESKVESSSQIATVLVDFECSQATLDAIVKSIYVREILIREENVIEILAVADYLQVTPNHLILQISYFRLIYMVGRVSQNMLSSKLLQHQFVSHTVGFCFSLSRYTVVLTTSKRAQ